MDDTDDLGFGDGYIVGKFFSIFVYKYANKSFYDDNIEAEEIAIYNTKDLINPDSDFKEIRIIINTNKELSYDERRKFYFRFYQEGRQLHMKKNIDEMDIALDVEQITVDDVADFDSITESEYYDVMWDLCEQSPDY